MTLPGFGTVYRYSGKHQSQSSAEYQAMLANAKIDLERYERLAASTAGSK